MSFAVDVNILLYASDSASPLFETARAFVADAAKGEEVVCLTWPTLMSYLRIATHPGIFGQPLSPAQAEGNLEALLGRPQVRALGELDGFWNVYSRATEGVPVRGNLVPDAHVAAILLQHGVRRFFTNDTDYRKFAFLEVKNPFSGE